MAKRIVKRTHANGKIDYAVESNRLLGFIPCSWYVVTTHLTDDVSVDAIFETYEEACIEAGIPVEGKEIVKQEVVKEI